LFAQDYGMRATLSSWPVLDVVFQYFSTGVIANGGWKFQSGRDLLEPSVLLSLPLP